ncbi:hypothetical protein X777_07556 [Ooceraea biroi]|uniref:Uncharacterized protein n=1 Tax=Ooceraea biroi TaxID=2015173 RepID=A0A026X375_OOCBI|nr:hypothetical protein X777_07556 [Ooceraea biroi]
MAKLSKLSYSATRSCQSAITISLLAISLSLKSVYVYNSPRRQIAPAYDVKNKRHALDFADTLHIR